MRRKNTRSRRFHFSIRTKRTFGAKTHFRMKLLPGQKRTFAVFPLVDFHHMSLRVAHTSSLCRARFRRVDSSRFTWRFFVPPAEASISASCIDLFPPRGAKKQTKNVFVFSQRGVFFCVATDSSYLVVLCSWPVVAPSRAIQTLTRERNPLQHQLLAFFRKWEKRQSKKTFFVFSTRSMSLCTRSMRFSTNKR